MAASDADGLLDCGDDFCPVLVANERSEVWLVGGTCVAEGEDIGLVLVPTVGVGVCDVEAEPVDLGSAGDSFVSAPFAVEPFAKVADVPGAVTVVAVALWPRVGGGACGTRPRGVAFEGAGVIIG